MDQVEVEVAVGNHAEVVAVAADAGDAAAVEGVAADDMAPMVVGIAEMSSKL